MFRVTKIIFIVKAVSNSQRTEKTKGRQTFEALHVLLFPFMKSVVVIGD